MQHCDYLTTLERHFTCLYKASYSNYIKKRIGSLNPSTRSIPLPQRPWFGKTILMSMSATVILACNFPRDRGSVDHTSTFSHWQALFAVTKSLRHHLLQRPSQKILTLWAGAGITPQFSNGNCDEWSSPVNGFSVPEGVVSDGLLFGSPQVHSCNFSGQWKPRNSTRQCHDMRQRRLGPDVFRPCKGFPQQIQLRTAESPNHFQTVWHQTPGRE